MHFIKTIEEGKITEFGKPKKIINTILSKIFFFEKERVVKVYKYQKTPYGNFADLSFRKKFYSEDFLWNKTVSPEIYLRLVGVKNYKNSFIFANPKSATDFYIEMKKVDNSQNLTNLLLQNRISETHIKRLTKSFIEKSRSLTKKLREREHPLFSRVKYGKLQDESLEDLRNSACLIAKYDSKNNVDQIITLLKAKIRQELYFANYDPRLLSALIDNNSDNLFILNGQPTFLDTMPPKENWRVGDEFLNIARLAISIYGFSNKNLSYEIYRCYEKYRPYPSPTVLLTYEIRGCLFQYIYRHRIGQHSHAKKFKKLLLQKVKQLKHI